GPLSLRRAAADLHPHGARAPGTAPRLGPGPLAAPPLPRERRRGQRLVPLGRRHRAVGAPGLGALNGNRTRSQTLASRARPAALRSPGFGPLLGRGGLAVLPLLPRLVHPPAVSRAPARATGRDLEVYYAAAQKALARRSPYVPSQDRFLRRSPETYVYPPPF